MHSRSLRRYLERLTFKRLSSHTSAAKPERTAPVVSFLIASAAAGAAITGMAIDADTIGTAITGMATIATVIAATTTTTMMSALSLVGLRQAQSSAVC
ncbi:hypothetical protein ASE60_09560 [Ensifer sp. Root278]|nr:hypothetical protein ASE60_09560 [Ensifer sp. Root278]